ncbi:Bifunctional riboflavin kinase/FMN adenylyltransferase [Vibrio stylophorae]|uniref:Riboflavin biosynthesis protein n=1 Tax=Vibrio stylophorae TaxID=659351 RepID=A0ABN8DRW1_9VIBR|nr:bifunctional riboflavin kinase/FAD synthetase [Vibrio stylophorae]CAH0532695.1 Bifunctional riboflavin kinase/FMN adenylyltransferase [Vibrio stylophorae]
MELIRGIHNLLPSHHGCVLTIGNFDGVHLGHQAVLKQVVEKAKELGLPATVMVFEPQPNEFFLRERAPARLTRLRDKWQHLSQCGIERVLCVNFNHHFAQLTAQQFIERLLVAQLGVKFLVVGDDFRFGQQRQGDFAMLQQAGEEHGFAVVSTDTFCHSHEQQVPCRVSSTAIRQALAQDDLAAAARMLGRPYSICGRVSHGRKLGRTIGFPTANIPLKRFVSPVNGVYVVTVHGLDQIYQGVANVGHRPTVGGLRQQLEVHLFDYQADLYGQQIEVQLRHKLRGEQKFASFEALQAQIAQDAQAARLWLLHNNNV